MAIQIIFEAIDKAAIATLQKAAKGIDGVTTAAEKNKQQTGLMGDVWKNLTSSMTAANLITGALQTGFRLLSDAVKDSINSTVNYANQVRNLQMVSGQTAEESSRMIQVFDDFKINIDSLTPAIRKMTSEGLQPNLSTIASLADEYNALATPLEKNAFLMDKFGRAGLGMAEMMSKGGDAIRAMSDGVDASLVMTQQGVDAARQYEMALDDWNDSVQAVKISLGNALLPVLTNMMNGMETSAHYTERQTKGLVYLKNELDDGRMTMERFVERAQHLGIAQADIERYTRGATTALQDQKQIVETINFDNMERMDLILNIQTKTDDFEKNKAEIVAKMDALKKEIMDAVDSGGDQTAIDGMIGDYTALKDELSANEAAFQQWQRQAVFALIQTKLAADGLTDIEFDKLLNIGESLGVIDPEVVTQAQALADAAENLANATEGVNPAGVEKVVEAIKEAPKDKSEKDAATPDKVNKVLDLTKGLSEALSPEAVTRAGELMDALTSVDTNGLDTAVNDIKYLVSQDGRTIRIYVEQTTTTSTTNAPTMGGMSTTAGGDTFINYGPQYFYGTTLSGILAEWR